jgi:PAS domain S-box-containing protein
LTYYYDQKHKPSDIRGGMSISLPMASVWSTQREGIVHRILGYGGMWLFGLLGIGGMSHRLRQQIARRQEAEQNLQEANGQLERRVVERTAELAEANSKLESEIVDRRQAEQWLLESEQRFRNYFEQGLIGMAIWGKQCDWIEVNNRLCKMLGYQEEELLVKPWQELVHTEDRASVEAELQRLTKGTNRGFVTSVRLIRKDGRTFATEMSAQCMQNVDGTLDCILISVQDMTHPKE